MLKLISPNIAIELSCTLIGIFMLWQDKSRVWKYFILFLIITVLTESTGLYIRKIQNGNNSWLYNIYMIFETGFLNLMFYHLLNQYIKSRPLILSGLALTLALYIYESINHGIYTYNSNTKTVLSLLMVIYALIYYYLLLKKDEYKNLAAYAPFWWVAGVLLFHFGSTMSNISFQKLSVYITPKYTLRYFIFIGLNLILYSLWSYSFICRYLQRRILP